jgi:hypothetical protein
MELTNPMDFANDQRVFEKQFDADTGLFVIAFLLPLSCQSQLMLKR